MSESTNQTTGIKYHGPPEVAAFAIFDLLGPSGHSCEAVLDFVTRTADPVRVTDKECPVEEQ